MTWGTFWMFYTCPQCGKQFKWGTDVITHPNYGACPHCGTQGTLIGESGATAPQDENSFQDGDL